MSAQQRFTLVADETQRFSILPDEPSKPNIDQPEHRQRFTVLPDNAARPVQPQEISADAALRMSREEFLKLPFEERARLSREIGEQARQPKINFEENAPGRGFVAATKRGFQSGVSGLLTGQQAAQAPEKPTWTERLGSLGGEMVSDLPAMALGGEAGLVGGATLGGLAGPVGAATGGVIGAGAGAFAAPTLIKQAFAEYRDFSNKGGDLTFGEFLNRAGSVAKETGKSAIVGGVTGYAGKLLPLLSKFPAGQKILNTKLGRGAATTATELGAMTGTQAALEGELPSREQIEENLAALVGTKIAHAASSKVKNVLSKEATREAPTPKIEPANIASENIPQAKATEQATETVKPDVKAEPLKTKPEVEKPVNEAKAESSKEALIAKLKKSKANPMRSETEQDIKSKRPVDKSWFNIAERFLPEAVREKGKALGNKILEKTPESIKELGRSVGKIRQNANEKMFFNMLEEHVGKRNAKIMESQFKWRESLEGAEQAGKFSKENLEEMSYYRQKTGNPFKPGDTYEALQARLPENAKKFVNDVVAPHLSDMLKEWNENPATKDINPREGLEEFYLPGLYENDPKKASKAYDEASKAFKTKNPFSNEKTFLNYMEAFEKAGLKPRYKSVVDLMKAYDQVMLKTMANSELVDRIKDVEKNIQEKLIVRSTDEEAYNKAKSMGYVPFDDVFLRRYVAGTKDGKPIWATTSAPALVHPDFGSAFQGVFKKDAYRPEHPFWKAYDAVGDAIRFTRVSLSPFHYGALMEHAVGAMGPKAFAIKKWMKEASSLRKDKAFMMDAAESGLKVHEHIEKHPFDKGQNLIDQAINAMPEKLAGVDLSKGLNKLRRGLGFLFEEFHPNIKLITWKNFSDAEIAKRIKKGNPPSEAEAKHIKREMAKLTNDIYGGQEWSTQKFLNNPTTMKWLRRVVAYPDWSYSSLKQAAGAFAPGIKGEQARKFWLKYGVGYLTVQGLLKYMNSGWEQTDKDKSISGLRWNPEKAYEGLTDGDPAKWYTFPLPDFDVKIAGDTFNPGRDAQNKKLYAHFGKQALEIAHYINAPFDELFAKANPLLQIGYKQIMGSTPYRDENFPVRGKYQGGKMLPWDATKPGTVARGVSRLKSLAEDVAPFALKVPLEKGVAPYIASGLGSVPISKGSSLYTMRPYLEKAIAENDTKKLNQLMKILRQNGYEDKSIKAAVTRARNQVKKEQEE